MKKTLLVAAIGCVICAPVYASDGGIYTDEPELQVTSNDFVRTERVVRPIAKPAPKPACGKCNKCATKTCGTPFEKVVNRDYFVRETIQVYQPVVTYVPAETYTTMRAVESPKCNKCGF